MKLINKFLVLNVFLVSVSSQSCYFDFEDDSELENFNLICNGQIGAWIIKNRNSDGTPLPDAGNRVLTVQGKEASSCLQSKNMIQVQENQQLTVEFFRKKTDYSDAYELSIFLRCEPNEEYSWDILTGSEDPNDGEWETKSHIFPTSETSCKLEVRLYIGGGKAEVEIDRILLNDLSSPDECYVVPKTTPPPSTTETTAEPTDTSTTEIPTTTTETQTTTTETQTTTTEISTTTTETPTTTTETPTTTTEIPKTTTETPTATTETPTTDTTVSPTTDITPPATVSTTETSPMAPTTTEDRPTTSTIPTSDSIPTETETTTNPSPQDYPVFAMFYFVVIIGTSGAIVFLAIGACWFILRKSQNKKDNHLS